MKLGIKKLLVSIAVPALLAVQSAQAHIVGITWNVLGNGDVAFDALHWHGDWVGSTGSAQLIVNGINYSFTSFTNNVSTYPGIAGLENPTYSHFDGDSLNILSAVNDWLHVTVPASAFLPTGQTNTLGSTPGPGQLSQWTLTGGITTFTFVLPPPPTSGVPDGGSTSLLIVTAGLALAGFKRFKK